MASALKTQTLIYVALFVAGASLIYMWSRACGGGSEGFADGGAADYEFIMYGVDWCGHCKKAKPEFAALGATKTIAGKTVRCAIVDPEKEAVTCGGKVDGYPTIRLCRRGGEMVQEYSGARNTGGFLKFLETNVA